MAIGSMEGTWRMFMDGASIGSGDVVQCMPMERVHSASVFFVVMRCTERIARRNPRLSNAEYSQCKDSCQHPYQHKVSLQCRHALCAA